MMVLPRFKRTVHPLTFLESPNDVALKRKSQIVKIHFQNMRCNRLVLIESEALVNATWLAFRDEILDRIRLHVLNLSALATLFRSIERQSRRSQVEVQQLG